MSEIGAVAPQARGDRVAAFGMAADGARQAEQAQGEVEVERFCRNVLRQRGTLRVLAVAGLDVGAEPALAQGNFESAVGIGSEDLRPTVALSAFRGAEAAGE